jgi:hypothetical protein
MDLAVVVERLLLVLMELIQSVDQVEQAVQLQFQEVQQLMLVEVVDLLYQHLLDLVEQVAVEQVQLEQDLQGQLTQAVAEVDLKDIQDLLVETAVQV